MAMVSTSNSSVALICNVHPTIHPTCLDKESYFSCLSLFLFALYQSLSV